MGESADRRSRYFNSVRRSRDRGGDGDGSRTLTDAYENWRRRLAGENVPIHDGKPECGRYKMRRQKNGPFLPVAIFMKDGEMFAAVGKEFVDPESIWLHAVKNPVSEADYKHAMQHGHFPDEPPPRTVGDNNPPDTIEEIIPLEIEQASEWLRSIGEITSQRDADIAGNRVSALRELKKQVEAKHKKEKEPHLAAGRAVDAKYKPLIEDVDGACKALLAAVTKFLNAERDRKAKEAREAYEREVAARVLERAQARDEGEPVEEELALPPPPQPVKVNAGGARGAKIALRSETIAVITDYEAVLHHFAHHEDIESCVQKLANRAAKAGVQVPGVKIEKVQKAA